jgi:hypothetical protein
MELVIKKYGWRERCREMDGESDVERMMERGGWRERCREMD